MLDSTTISTLTDLKASTVYRFRFLNGNYDDANSIRYSFRYGDCGSSASIVNFTLIGTDSSLFNKGLDDQQGFVISNGERVELLIVFSANFTNVSICGENAVKAKFVDGHSKLDSNRPVSGAKSIYNINNIKLQPKANLNFNDSSIKNLTFPSVAYVNLTDPVYEQKVAVRRMRPLIRGGGMLTIHGRADYHSGHSENPKIGDVEDWFIINTFPDRQHPIHVHLINFQVVKQYSLRMLLNTSCSLYGMDFYAAAISYAGGPNSTVHYPDVDELYKAVFASGKVNYTILCNQFGSIGKITNLTDALASIFPENVADKNKISGLDVLKECTAEDEDNLKPYNMSCKGGSLYITNPGGEPHSRSFYGRWKDTAFVETLKVFHYRIRWAKSDYNQTRDKSNYFNVPSDQLREYPGFVYHCHILFHEDNEMMRPIMLQLPDGVVPNSTCSQV
jgi:FtsP/CotA-like multicopper oxidase with cupredoxin domain